MSWLSADLPLVTLAGGSGGEFWSTADAAWLLDVSQRAVREAVRRAGIEAAGKRHDRGRGTRHVRVYRAEELLQALGMTGEEFGGKFF